MPLLHRPKIPTSSSTATSLEQKKEQDPVPINSKEDQNVTLNAEPSSNSLSMASFMTAPFKRKVVDVEAGKDGITSNGNSNANGTSSQSKKNRPKSDGNQAENNPTVKPVSFAPQIKIIDGKVVLDQESVQISQNSLINDSSDLKIVEESGELINSASFRRKRRRDSLDAADATIALESSTVEEAKEESNANNSSVSVTQETNHEPELKMGEKVKKILEKSARKLSASNSNNRGKWSAEDDAKFFQGLAIWGTDFSMIAQMFPGRTRTEIKNKYKREEKNRPTLMQQAMCPKKTPFSAETIKNFFPSSSKNDNVEDGQDGSNGKK